MSSRSFDEILAEADAAVTTCTWATFEGGGAPILRAFQGNCDAWMIMVVEYLLDGALAYDAVATDRKSFITYPMTRVAAERAFHVAETRCASNGL